MECSRAVESLDSLWFFRNILARARPSSSAAEAEETEEKEEEEEPIKNPANEPEASEDPLPQCPPRCGNLDAEVAEPGATTSPTEEAAGTTPESAEEEPKLDERRVRRSKRRQRSKRLFCERRRGRVLGDLDPGCEGKDFPGLEENHFLGNRCRGFGVGGEVRAMREEMPPLSDGIAMREHLRSWAIAVACAVNVK